VGLPGASRRGVVEDNNHPNENDSRVTQSLWSAAATQRRESETGGRRATFDQEPDDVDRRRDHEITGAPDSHPDAAMTQCDIGDDASVESTRAFRIETSAKPLHRGAAIS